MGTADVIALTGAGAHVEATIAVISADAQANLHARATDETAPANVTGHVGAADVTPFTLRAPTWARRSR